ncbi:uncharacterized protein LOC114180344 isoform X2 [Vigna unguiculata]|uniref:uncharacterized protein LOC114180344 isoform X2 n=1 Tax=Vigna unguiculata TaxID=3917 RepID=UPI001017029E|nr:uncharacterized protein LOC114180344 isoform X2 [Vigna unguiculata]XP_027922442.1 uncharacterized protein LOC114180344 isoform X2 [Vigna unguiculata]
MEWTSRNCRTPSTGSFLPLLIRRVVAEHQTHPLLVRRRTCRCDVASIVVQSHQCAFCDCQSNSQFEDARVTTGFLKGNFWVGSVLSATIIVEAEIGNFPVLSKDKYQL